MPKILRMSDRARLKIKDVEFIWAPLSEKNRMEIRNCTMIINGIETVDVQMSQSLMLKYTLKEIKGVEDYHGKSYSLKFEGDYLTDDCVSEVRSIEWTDLYLTAAYDMIERIPEKLTDAEGKELKGVALELLPNLTRSG